VSKLDYQFFFQIKENIQERLSRFWNERWTVPWTGQTIAQVSSTSGGHLSIAATSLIAGYNG
jgi:hypothetical protein